jgi:WD40 repeat protein/uncharacterized caspase-like protein
MAISRRRGTSWVRNGRGALLGLVLCTSVLVGKSSARPQEEPPKLWAVVAGIDKYDDRTFPDRAGGAASALAVRQWLVGTAGWPAEQVFFLHDTGLRQPPEGGRRLPDLAPTRANLDAVIDAHLAPAVRPGDLVVIYYAGRAVVRTDGAAGPRVLLAPIDAAAADLERTAWRLDAAVDRLTARGARAVVTWLDLGIERPAAAERASVEAALRRWLGQLTRWPGATSWLAEAAPEKDDPRLFASALVEALGPRAYARPLPVALERLRPDGRVLARRFQIRGGVAPDLTLWSDKVRARARPEAALLLQRAHGDRITSMAYTSDGEILVTAGFDSTVRLWRVSDQTLLGTLPEHFHLAGVTALALSPGGTRVASGDGAGLVRFWDFAENRELVLRGTTPHGMPVGRLVFADGGSRCLSLDADGRAAVWDLSGRDVTVREVPESVAAVAAAPDADAGGVALILDDGSLRVGGGDPATWRPLPRDGARPTAMAFSADGRRLAVGDEAGRVAVLDLGSNDQIAGFDYEKEITSLVFLGNQRIASAGGDALHVAGLAPDSRDEATFEVVGGVDRLVASIDGRHLAASDRRTGAVHAWNFGAPAQPRDIRLTGHEATGPASSSLAFAPDGRTLASGDQDGGLRFWSIPEGSLAARQAPRRGKVATLDLSADRRFVLQVTRDRSVLVWDLGEGRDLTPILGSWTSGAIAPDGSFLAMTRGADGAVVLVDRDSGRPRATAFERPKLPRDGAEITWRFGATNDTDGSRLIALSGDGRRVASGSAEGPLACVWDAENGRLVAVVQAPDHGDRMAAVDLSDDGRTLLTADASGAVKLWEIVAAGDDRRPKLLASFARDGEPATAARIAPARDGAPLRIASAHATRDEANEPGGHVLVWEVGRDAPIAAPGTLRREIRALAFTPDGRWLLVGGGEKTLRMVPVEGPGAPIRLDEQVRHGEQVNAVAVRPLDADGTRLLVASGSDDTAVRLWALDPREAGAGWETTPLGTLAATQEPDWDPRTQPREDASRFATSWVAYTPDGLFDGAPGAERQVTWRLGDAILPLEQYAQRTRVFRLAETLRDGRRPEAPVVRADPPRLALDEPPPPEPGRGEVELTVALGSDDVADLRLYQNGIPVRSDDDFAREPGRARVRVSLLPGENQFYAMAGRAQAIDGRSNDVRVRFDGPRQPVRLHVLALGVGAYEAPGRALRYPQADARELAGHLHRFGYQVGEMDRPDPLVLLDNEIDDRRVEDVLAELRQRVAGRPEDIVVVALAGHATVRDERFYLLLPGYPFADAVPPPSGTMLAYARLYRGLTRLDALRRLVVVDACGAGAVLDDRSVRQMERFADDAALRARTSYILAARKGEPAGEATPLGHGLLSYVLLRGLGADVPALDDVPLLSARSNADLDGDDLVTTAELGTFARQGLVALAGRFPDQTLRVDPGGSPSGSQSSPTIPLVRATAGGAFPLVRLPESAAAPGTSGR